MGNPDELLDAVRDKLRAIAAVVALMDGTTDLITSYADDKSSLATAVYEMEEPSLLVALDSGEFTEEGNAQFLYTVAIYLRLLPAQRLGGAFRTICAGIPSGGDGQPFHSTQHHADFELIGLPTIRRDTDDDGGEYPAIVMRFRDKTNG